jgi:hypothetical protein
VKLKADAPPLADFQANGDVHAASSEWPIRVPKTQSAFHAHAQRNAFHRRDAHRQGKFIRPVVLFRFLSQWKSLSFVGSQEDVASQASHREDHQEAH